LTNGPFSVGSTPGSHKNATSSASFRNSHETNSFIDSAILFDSAPQDKHLFESNISQQSTQASSSTSSDADCIQQTLTQSRQASNHITSILQQTSSLQSHLKNTIDVATNISNSHEALLRHSSDLSHAAERLQTESEELTKHANEIGLPLKHYDAVDTLSTAVGVLFKNDRMVKGLARVKVDSTDEFVQVLQDIDAAILFFAERSELSSLQNGTASSSTSSKSKNDPASGSLEYYKRAKYLQEAALDLLKEAIVHRVQQVTLQITSALDLKRKAVTGDNLEASLIYTRFHGISNRSCRLLGIISSRQRADVGGGDAAAAAACAYTTLWKTCRDCYIQSRESLLKLSVRTHLDFLKDKHGLVGMTRLASVFLMRLCTIETSLYLDFFGDEESDSAKVDKSSHEGMNGTANGTGNGKKSNKSKNAASLASQVMSKDGTYFDAEFQSYLDTLCNNLHRTIRRGLVSVLDLDTLCQIVSVLREERNLASASPTTMAAARSLGKVIVDTQERLIFCANTTLNKEVVRFKATPADLDYPDKLRRWKESMEEMDSSVKTANGSGGKEEVAMQKQMQIYELWFPPIRNVLKVLSKIFRVVEPSIFEDIALSSVQSCTKQLKIGSSFIEKKSGVLHSDLFLVKHLLILREQLSPFDIELRSVERQLDFSDAGKAVSRFLANRNRRLFSMSTENALVALLREGISTREASIDSKRDLEDALRSACNDFIEHTCLDMAGSIVTFVEQCKSISASGSTSDSLESQAFLKPDYVKAVVTRALDRLEPAQGEVVTQMELYMDNPGTQSILMKPVVKKIVRMLEETKRFIVEGTKNDSQGWNSELREDIMSDLKQIEVIVKLGKTA